MADKKWIAERYVAKSSGNLVVSFGSTIHGTNVFRQFVAQLEDPDVKAQLLATCDAVDAEKAGGSGQPAA